MCVFMLIVCSFLAWNPIQAMVWSVTRKRWFGSLCACAGSISVGQPSDHAHVTVWEFVRLCRQHCSQPAEYSGAIQRFTTLFLQLSSGSFSLVSWKGKTQAGSPICPIALISIVFFHILYILLYTPVSPYVNYIPYVPYILYSPLYPVY